MSWFSPEPDAGSHSADMLHHYTTRAGLAGILDSGVLRLSELSKMNDPRENRAYNFASVGGSGPVPDSYRTSEYTLNLRETANAVLRDKVRLFSATVDSLISGGSGYWGRGFARARNWHQYAEAHQGAVLVFDRETLVDLAQSVNGVERVLHGPVSYIDRQIEQASEDTWLGFNTSDLETRSPREIAEDWQDRFSNHLYFEKSLDWASEQEYRIVALADGEVEIPIATALRAVILGEITPAYEANVLGTRLRRLGVSSLSVMRMFWQSGHPGAMVVGGELPGLFPLPHEGQFKPLFDDEPPPSEGDLRLMCTRCGGTLRRLDADWEKCESCGNCISRA